MIIILAIIAFCYFGGIYNELLKIRRLLEKQEQRIHNESQT
ncbi:hypothetical protein EDD63_11529 [Breznakia blatticola]|uniref:CcmD family protein n=1 Tax=Breznakia blatticola TaxID=1754012 RepID=A0A4R7ZT36_9FIRM|nr:hypothetical protein [Breznakia sp. PH1-1]MDH6403943.1 hypothetical protein [Breznakia sp. PF1-11]MDH6411652.1 hypothetical protein [Breznakia sp. PFB1-11]MDH6414578.1 hypothetical protein [Breznakia sp. PFB1-14]MDH6416003.1 hypothetical protein [Breznakia sp. PFB1-4]MDH6418684.1 hypothetical protein [Breznakia sp. PFB1-12]MDH6473494.1 hypothetical protein [Breznakia sp. PFB2-30]MDH6475930.1 hypothetical protein [Breznakia sp. PFB1-19]TDW20071.1 hypothetical protein EDD63_11529 [Breznaki